MPANGRGVGAPCPDAQHGRHTGVSAEEPKGGQRCVWAAQRHLRARRARATRAADAIAPTPPRPHAPPTPPHIATVHARPCQFAQRWRLTVPACLGVCHRCLRARPSPRPQAFAWRGFSTTARWRRAPRTASPTRSSAACAGRGRQTTARARTAPGACPGVLPRRRAVGGTYIRCPTPPASVKWGLVSQGIGIGQLVARVCVCVCVCARSLLCTARGTPLRALEHGGRCPLPHLARSQFSSQFKESDRMDACVGASLDAVGFPVGRGWLSAGAGARRTRRGFLSVSTASTSHTSRGRWPTRPGRVVSAVRGVAWPLPIMTCAHGVRACALAPRHDRSQRRRFPARVAVVNTLLAASAGAALVSCTWVGSAARCCVAHACSRGPARRETGQHHRVTPSVTPSVTLVRPLRRYHDLGSSSAGSIKVRGTNRTALSVFVCCAAPTPHR